MSKIHTFSQPDYKMLIANSEKLLAEWDRHVK
jgi:hypothetical protein